MKPSVGRIVHYVSYGTLNGEYSSTCRAAIVTHVHAADPEDDGVYAALCVLNPEGMFFNQGVIQDEQAHKGGTWHWPERVDPVALSLRPLDLSPAQVQQVVEKVQAALLQQAKRNRRPGSA